MIEYILMLGALTLIGAFIMKSMIGSQKNPKNGAVNSMATTATKHIAEDER